MRGRWIGRASTALAVAAVGLACAGCFPSSPQPPPPAPPAHLTVSPSPANFPTIGPPYNPMPIVQVTVTNTGGHVAQGIVVNPVGVYSVPSNNCSALAPGHSCVADIQFCPNSPGPYVNTLVVNGQDAATGAPLQGTTTLNGAAT